MEEALCDIQVKRYIASPYGTASTHESNTTKRLLFFSLSRSFFFFFFQQARRSLYKD